LRESSLVLDQEARLERRRQEWTKSIWFVGIAVYLLGGLGMLVLFADEIPWLGELVLVLGAVTHAVVVRRNLTAPFVSIAVQFLLATSRQDLHRLGFGLSPHLATFTFLAGCLFPIAAMASIPAFARKADQRGEAVSGS
jgi:hypothetical protein